MSARLKITPTTRTLAKLRADGWLADVVERRERYFTSDCFENFDVLGFRAMAGTAQSILVQCTSAPNVAARVKKCKANPLTEQLIECGVRCEVWGWREDKPDPRIEVL